MAVGLDSKGDMSLSFNGISSEGNDVFAHLTASPDTWAEILHIIENFQDFGVHLQAYTGISDIHANIVIDILKQHVQGESSDLVIQDEDFKAIDALLTEYEKYGYGRFKDPQKQSVVAEDRYQHLKQECGAVRLQIEAAL